MHEFTARASEIKLLSGLIFKLYQLLNSDKSVPMMVIHFIKSFPETWQQLSKHPFCKSMCKLFKLSFFSENQPEQDKINV